MEQLFNWLAQSSVNTMLGSLASIANCVLVFIAYKGLQQLRIAKDDISIRSKREAATLAVAQCEKFARELIPRQEELLRQVRALGIPKYPGPYKDFRHAELSTAQLSPLFIPANLALAVRVCSMLNDLEAVAIYFEQGIADADIAYPSIASAFCQIAEEYYAVIAGFRPEKNGQVLYTNLVGLYKRWAPRLQHSLLSNQKNVLEKSISGLAVLPSVKPMGTEGN